MKTKWIKWHVIDRGFSGPIFWEELKDSEDQLEVAREWARDKNWEMRGGGCNHIEWELAEPPIEAVQEEFVKVEEEQARLQNKWLRIEKILMEYEDGDAEGRV